MLSGGYYQRFKMQTEFVRAKGYDLKQMEQMALEYLHSHGEISHTEVSN